MTLGSARDLNSRVWTLLIIFALLQAAFALFTYSMSLGFDESIWYYIGRNWFRHGMVPYSGGVDNKSPLIFAIFGFSDYLFGVSEWFPRMLGTVGQTVGLYFLYRIAGMLAGEKVALLALTIYGLSLLWPSSGGKYVAYPETYSVAAVIISYYLFYKAEGKKNSILSGILGGIGIGFRLSAVFAILGLLLSASLYRPKSILPIIGGLAISLVALMAAAWISKVNLAEYLEFGFIDNFGRGSPTDHSLIWKLRNFSSHFIFSGFIIFLPALIAWFFIPTRSNPIFIWWCFAFLGIHIIGIYSTQHFKEILPPLALMAAMVIDYFTRQWHGSPAIVFLTVWIIFFPKTLEPFISLRNYLFKQPAHADLYCTNKETVPDEATKKRLGLWIKSATNETDQVLIAGYGAEIQAYAERISPIVYFNTTQTEMAIRKFKSDLGRERAAMVLIPAYSEYKSQVIPELREAMDDFVARDYKLDSCVYGFNVYRLKSIMK
jgi:hypothetical protein